MHVLQTKLLLHSQKAGNFTMCWNNLNFTKAYLLLETVSKVRNVAYAPFIKRCITRICMHLKHFFNIPKIEDPVDGGVIV